MLEELRRQVYEANMMLQKHGLVKFTWGNVSGIDRDQGLVVIKPSGVPYEELSPENMVILDMDGNVVEGDMSPSTDTPTHIALYKAFDTIGGVVHTHSLYATIWAQAGLDITAYGTTHADHFYGDIPCTNQMRDDQIEEEYELQTGFHIADTFSVRGLNYEYIPACLVASHGPFAWGKDPAKAVENAVVLEEVAHMALYNASCFEFGLPRIQDSLLNKHFMRKHGPNAYYGQTGKETIEINEDLRPNVQDIQIEPSQFTTELQNISDFGEVGGSAGVPEQAVPTDIWGNDARPEIPVKKADPDELLRSLLPEEPAKVEAVAEPVKAGAAEEPAKAEAAEEPAKAEAAEEPAKAEAPEEPAKAEAPEEPAKAEAPEEAAKAEAPEEPAKAEAPEEAAKAEAPEEPAKAEAPEEAAEAEAPEEPAKAEAPEEPAKNAVIEDPADLLDFTF